jgi:hypothetical protein
MTRAIAIAGLALAAAVTAGVAGAASVLRPDEAQSQDTFIYAFGVPGTLGVPGVPADLNFDTPNIPATALAPFGQFLGVAESAPFTLPGDPTPRIHTTLSLLKFDLASLGVAPDRVGSAIFTLTGIGNLPPFAPPSAAFPITVDVRAVTAVWDEQTVTWNTRPGTGALLASAQMTGGTQTLSFDLTAAVMGWLGDPSSSFGIEISQREIVETDIPSPFNGGNVIATGLFASSANPSEAIRPTLTVSAVPLPAPALLLAGGGALLAGLRLRRRRRG